MQNTRYLITLFTVLCFLVAGCGQKAEDTTDAKSVDSTESVNKSGLETKDSVIIAMAGIDGKISYGFLKNKVDIDFNSTLARQIDKLKLKKIGAI